MKQFNTIYITIFALLMACSGGTPQTQEEKQSASDEKGDKSSVTEYKAEYAEGEYYAIPNSAYPKASLSSIPDEATVGIPAYPKAYLLSYATSDDLLPGLVLVSSDPIDVVHSFYKEKLSEWVYDERMQLYWPGPGDYKLSQHMGKVSSVTLSEWDPESFWSKNLPKNVKTSINIIFEPKK